LTSIVVRADASVEIGSGHLRRCLVLAERLRQRGAGVTFICRRLPGHLGELLAARDFPVVWLSPAAPWTPAADAAATAAILESVPEKPAWLIVDHYRLDRDWERRLRPLAARIMVIDDLADRAHDCDLLLDQNYHGDEDEAQERYRGLVPAACRLLLGPRYALLDPRFAARRAAAGEEADVTGKEKPRLLLFFGGTDPGNETGRALEGIKPLLPALAVEVVVGAGNPHRQLVREMCAGLPGVRYHCQVEDMAALLAEVDLAVGAGGTSAWERCCLGVPSIVASIAANQVPLAVPLARDGYLLYLGEAAALVPADYRQAVATLLRSPWWRAFMARRCRQLADGRGVFRVVDRLLPPALTLRRARAADEASLLAWRNAPENRRFSFSPAVITAQEHHEWFARCLAAADRELLIGEEDGRPVGVLRYDLAGEEALVSIYLVPGCHGRGYGRALLAAGSFWLRRQRPAVKRLRAEVLPANRAARQLFDAAGFAASHLVFRQEL